MSNYNYWGRTDLLNLTPGIVISFSLGLGFILLKSDRKIDIKEVILGFHLTSESIPSTEKGLGSNTVIMF